MRPRRQEGRHSRRRAVTLLEVLVSVLLALILVGSVGTLATFSTDRAIEMEQQTQATLLCQSKMAQVMTGVVPMQNAEWDPLPDDLSEGDGPRWKGAMTVENMVTNTGLYKVKITVSREISGAKIEAELSQIVFDPAQRGNAADAAAANAGGAGTGAAGTSGGIGAASGTTGGL